MHSADTQKTELDKLKSNVERVVKLLERGK